MFHSQIVISVMHMHWCKLITLHISHRFVGEYIWHVSIHAYICSKRHLTHSYATCATRRHVSIHACIYAFQPRSVAHSHSFTTRLYTICGPVLLLHTYRQRVTYTKVVAHQGFGHLAVVNDHSIVLTAGGDQITTHLCDFCKGACLVMFFGVELETNKVTS